MVLLEKGDHLVAGLVLPCAACFVDCLAHLDKCSLLGKDLELRKRGEISFSLSFSTTDVAARISSAREPSPRLFESPEVVAQVEDDGLLAVFGAVRIEATAELLQVDDRAARRAGHHHGVDALDVHALVELIDAVQNFERI